MEDYTQPQDLERKSLVESTEVRMEKQDDGSYNILLTTYPLATGISISQDILKDTENLIRLCLLQGMSYAEDLLDNKEE